MQIARITKETASEASHIYADSWKICYRGIVPQAYLDELSRERWTPKLGDSPYWDYMMTDGGQPIATSTLAPARDAQMTGWGEIISLYVRPEHYRQGYGRAMMAFDLAELHRRGYSDVYLWVLEENRRARAFYAQMGFAPDGGRAPLTIGGATLFEVRYIHRG